MVRCGTGGRGRWRDTLLILLVVAGFGSWSAQGPAHADDVAPPAKAGGTWTDPEKWVWAQLLKGDVANLDNNPACDQEKHPPPAKADDPAWQNPCRSLRAAFLHDILTRAPWREALPHQGAQIAGARIAGDLNLSSADLIRPIWISDSRFEGSFNLLRATTKSLIGLVGVALDGEFSAGELHSDNSLMFGQGTTFARGLNCIGATIAGQVALIGVSVTGTLNADALKAGNLYMRPDATNESTFDAVVLRGARVAGQIDMTGANVTGTLNGDALQAGDLYLRSNAAHKGRFKEVVLRGARIAGQVDLTGAIVDGTLNADSLQAGDLLMFSDTVNKSSFRDVILRGARVRGQIALIGANVTGTLNGDTLQAGDLFLRSDYAGDGDNGITSIAGSTNLVFARIGSNLDLRGATLADVDLSGATINGELRLGFSGGKVTTWQDKDGHPSTLNARTTSIGTVSDAQSAWPATGRLRLDRVSIGHLGGFDGDTAKRMRDRGMDWWDDWARRDPDFSPAPYTQLASAFASMGDRDAANDIRFLGRAREREARCAESLWGGSCISLFAQEYIVGFGINPYTFRVLAWVFDFAMLGTWILWTFVPAARMAHRGFLWCCGASLSRLLPVIEINKEFTDFFDDPDRTRLNGWQSVAFSALGVVGWILGAFLVAALSGLTQGS